MKTYFLIFATVFVAEIGDKTQLATMLYATDASLNRFWVFAAAGAALLFSSMVAVLAGSVVTRYIAPEILRIVAGAGFIVIGLWTLVTALR